MSAHRKICFAADSELYERLFEGAERQNLSLDDFLHHVIQHYLQDHSGFSKEREKRSYRRAKLSLPVIVRAEKRDNEVFARAGVVNDISVGGMRITVPKRDMVSDEYYLDFDVIEILMKLPDTGEPSSFTCEIIRTTPTHEGVEFGARFVEADLDGVQAIHKYMM
jgi:hypothetical protein